MRWPVALLLLAVSAIPAAAQEEAGNCTGFGRDDDPANVELRRVSSEEARLNFFDNPDQHPGCPDDNESCKLSTFLVPGDRVIVSRNEAGFGCSSFVNGRGRETTGWLPLVAMESLRPAPNWVGQWKRDESAQISIAPDDGDVLLVSGEATVGSGAATHTGEFSVHIKGDRNRATFATDGEQQKAFKDAGEGECAVNLVQLGPYLVVKDNFNCGGANVSFTGIYIRR